MKFWYERGAWVSKKTRLKLASIQPEQIKSIAIIRHAALGDMILTRAFIHEARQFFPNAKITLSVVSNYTYGAPEDMVDRLHIAYGNDRRDIPKLEQIRRARSLGEHDIIFDLAVSTRSVWLCLLNKASLKIGYPYRYAQRWLYDAAIFRSDFEFEAQIMLDMLRLLGAKPATPPDFQIHVAAAKQEQSSIIYFTSASALSKCWPKPHFIDLIRQAAGDFPDHQHMILNGQAEWEDAADIKSALQDLENVSLQQSLPLEQTLALIKAADLVVCNDTGIRNLAICCETPTLGIFFSTVPYRYWPRYGKHRAAFNANGSIPSVADVYKEMQAVFA